MKRRTLELAIVAAGILDAAGSTAAPIRVAVTRRTLMRQGLRHDHRGAALNIGKHEVIPRERR